MNDDDVTISWQECEKMVARAFLNAGVPAEVAKLVAHHLVMAEAEGQAGHGLTRVPSYLAQLRSGKIRADAKIAIKHEKPSLIEVDAGFGFAYPALQRALDALIEVTPKQGIAMAVISHSHHAGVLGHWVEQIADAGLVGLAFANTPAAIAPWGGQIPLFGTNPIAFSAPREKEAPLVLDLSLSKVARGKILRAQSEGRNIPDDWAFDKDGQPTTHADAALAGAMRPAGDAKGAALALMVEILAAGLGGSSFAFEASSFFDGAGAPPDVGQVLMAIDPPNAGFVKRAEVLFGAILAQEGTRLSGQNIRSKREKARSNGIVTSRKGYEKLKKLEAIID